MEATTTTTEIYLHVSNSIKHLYDARLFQTKARAFSSFQLEPNSSTMNNFFSAFFSTLVKTDLYTVVFERERERVSEKVRECERMCERVRVCKCALELPYD